MPMPSLDLSTTIDCVVPIESAGEDTMSANDVDGLALPVSIAL